MKKILTETVSFSSLFLSRLSLANANCFAHSVEPDLIKKKKYKSNQIKVELKFSMNISGTMVPWVAMGNSFHLVLLVSSQKHSARWISYTKLPLGVNDFVNVCVVPWHPIQSASRPAFPVLRYAP